MLFSQGFFFWVYLFVFFIFAIKKQWDYVLSWGIVWTLIGTLLMGPTTLVRYVRILWFGLPVLLSNLYEI